ncbi:MAG: hypothetical protein ABJ327_19320 [Litoreibacter sp.]
MSNLGPVFRVLEGPSPTQVGIPNAVTDGMGTILSAASTAAEIFAHDEAGLLQILHFRIQIAKAARRRGRWFGGRIYNKFSGEIADYIPMSGTHLRQSLPLVGIDPPSFVVASGKYELRLDLAEQAAKRLMDNRDQVADQG